MANTKKRRSKKAKTFLGLPVNWDRSKILSDLWDENDERVVHPRGFGIGWTVNFHALLKKVGYLKDGKSK